MSDVRSEFESSVLINLGEAGARSISGGNPSRGVGEMDVDGELYDCSRST